ncbi:MAG: hypothetical protein J7K26_02280 [Candidatus Aenigmarchaeota archaeon]|nr:hypothetical protein [Candidatus Aenigmarchaeota archaeon]
MSKIVSKQSLPKASIKKEKGKQRLLKTKIIEELEKNKDNILPYSKFYKKYKRDSVKEKLLELEKDGKIEIFPRRDKNNLMFTTHIKLIKDVADCDYINEHIKTFKSFTSGGGKITIIYDKILEASLKRTIVCPKIFDFFKECLTDNKILNDEELAKAILKTFHHVIVSSINYKYINMLKKLDKMERDNKLTSSLERIIIKYPVNDNLRYHASRVLNYINTNKNIDILFDIIGDKNNRLFAEESTFASIIVEASKILPNKKEYIRKKADMLLTKDLDSNRQRVLKIIIKDV